jgi:hypothetical protein
LALAYRKDCYKQNRKREAPFLQKLAAFSEAVVFAALHNSLYRAAFPKRAWAPVACVKYVVAANIAAVRAVPVQTPFARMLFKPTA